MNERTSLRNDRTCSPPAFMIQLVVFRVDDDDDFSSSLLELEVISPFSFSSFFLSKMAKHSSSTSFADGRLFGSTLRSLERNVRASSLRPSFDESDGNMFSSRATGIPAVAIVVDDDDDDICDTILRISKNCCAWDEEHLIRSECHGGTPVKICVRTQPTAHISLCCVDTPFINVSGDRYETVPTSDDADGEEAEDAETC